MTKLSENIIRLRSEGKSYSQIKQELGCSKATICYHLGEGQKTKTRDRTQKLREENIISILNRKIDRFKNRKDIQKRIRDIHDNINKKLYMKYFDFQRRGRKMTIPENTNFTSQDIIDKFGLEPACYLTGKKIDLFQPHTYHFDHKTPASKGGDNSLDNLGICTKEANMSKSDLTIDEYIDLCKKVLTNFGYIISK